MTDPLLLELQLHEYLRERLLVDFPEEDEETLADTLEGMTDLHDKLAVIIRSQQEDRVISVALKERIQEMQGRLSRIQGRVEKKRDLVVSVMDRAGIRKISEADFTASLRATPRPLVISDEEAVPENYWKTPPPKLDKKLLMESLAGDREIPGACLGNGGVTVSVRVR